MKKSLIILMTTLLIFSACKFNENESNLKRNDQSIEENYKISATIPESSSKFSEYLEESISYKPSIPEYSGSFPEDVIVSPEIYINPDYNEYLDKNNFLVDSTWYMHEFFPIYEANRYDIVPNFITTDSALHTYHIYFNYLLEQLESEKLIKATVELTDLMLEESEKQMGEFRGTMYEPIAKQNLAYFAVAKSILDDKYKSPDSIEKIVSAELEQINAHEGISVSNIIGIADNPLNEDYSQYIPRGHYTKTAELEKYFKAMMWYGRISFRLSNDKDTLSSILITKALLENKEAYGKWKNIFEPINFFVGETDDLTFEDYKNLYVSIFGQQDTNANIQNSEKISLFKEKALALKNPLINSMPVLAPIIEDNDINEETKGFRFLGQRFTVDAMIMQKLVYRNVEADLEGNLRMLPKALDIPAVFGSEEALTLLTEMGETEYAGYSKNIEKLKTIISKYETKDWGSSLYWAWMYTLKAFTNGTYGAGYPKFMQNNDWKLKELVTFLASFTELKHDTILYTKQVYAEMGGGPFIEQADDRGYVEPNPELYNRLLSIVRLTKNGLSKDDMLTEKMISDLEKLETMVKTLRDISIKELENKTLSDEEYEFIRNYGGSLEHFWYEALTDEQKNEDQQAVLNGHGEAVIADIATNPNGVVLEEGTGAINKIYVVFPIDGELHLGVGGVMSHYEFEWPMNDRLTDEAWRKLLFPYESYPYERESEFIPKLADWQTSFTIPNETDY